MNNLDMNNLDMNSINNLTNSPIMNDINNLINEVNQSNLIQCDDECQKNKRLETLFENYKKALHNVEEAPELLEEAERKYLIATKGIRGYNEIQERTLIEKAKQMAKSLISLFQEKEKEVNVRLQKYKQQIKYNNNMDDLQEQYKEKLKRVIERKEELENDVNVANRESYYTDEKLFFVYSLTGYLRILYWIFCIVYIIIVVLSKKYKIRFYQIISAVLILFALLPFQKIINVSRRFVRNVRSFGEKITPF